jgi:hypothetical protein
MNRRTIGLALLGMIWVGTLSAVTVPAGTPIKVRLQNTINSGTAKSGEGFTAVLDEPLAVEGKTVAPKGANVKGIVSKAVSSGRLSTPAELYLRLTSIEINGKSQTIQTGSVGRKGESHKKRDTIGIGGGSAVGAIIGGIAGGGKGAAIGAGAGAAAGTAGAAATGKKDIEYRVETRLTFSLKQALNVP